ncbi:MAG: UDP-N-acetylmuramoyl-L-alanyl-D-glutamate--2,6-diaminopimelate ligase [Ilumatobacteraceae bacterium]
MTSGSMSLARLLTSTPNVVPVTLTGDLEVGITGIAYDSNGVISGSLFCCLPGERFDGHDFADEAIRGGAVALLVSHQVSVAVPQVQVNDVRQAMAWLSAAFYGYPSQELHVIGVTGTNGKTTTAHLMAAILHQHGWPTEVFGTLSSVRTTPEAPDLQRKFAEQLQAGKRAIVMEVSSHALAQDRVLGTRFRASIFTNLSREHLDYHGTMERYFSAKATLFRREFTDVGIINRDDVHGKLLVDSIDIDTETFGESDASDIKFDASRHSFTWRKQRIEVSIGGRFNVMNSLAAATAAAKLGVAPYDIVTGLAAAGSVPGRFEAVNAGQQFDVIVDYAHTPDAMQRVLQSARSVARGGRVIVVFGCGGDRDQDKRPEMGRTAVLFADVVVVTSDNPRSESPESITAQIISGISPELSGRLLAVEHDRRLAIGMAFGVAKVGDVVVIAGKGHETTQTIGESVIQFSDVEVARDLLQVAS